MGISQAVLPFQRSLETPEAQKSQLEAVASADEEFQLGEYCQTNLSDLTKPPSSFWTLRDSSGVLDAGPFLEDLTRCKSLIGWF